VSFIRFDIFCLKLLFFFFNYFSDYNAFLYSARDRRLEVYANLERTPDNEIATTYYDYMSLYIDSLRMHQDKLRDEILWLYIYIIPAR
jgi:hypothetical protein